MRPTVRPRRGKRTEPVGGQRLIVRKKQKVIALSTLKESESYTLSKNKNERGKMTFYMESRGKGK